ncbi:MAG: DoxX family protein [Robiginitalea sp.]|uniref:DoxX family protein n=1 Tax=Robiginitalea sp. TaxID=1902411 RepID=UPI003C71D09B
MNVLTDYAAEVLLLIFLVITFIQSGLDKLLDWKGNLTWLSDHFSQTPFKTFVPTLFIVLTIMELAAGILCGIGLIQLLMGSGNNLAFLGALVSCIVLLMLLFGQRIAKDYEGARTIVVYFIPAIFLLFLLQ